MTGSAALGVGALLAFHVLLISSGNGTIDFFKHMGMWREARRQRFGGRGLAGWVEAWRAVNPHHLGVAENWRAAFDVSGGRLWWLRLLLPSRRPKAGNGWAFPVHPAAAAAARQRGVDGAA